MRHYIIRQCVSTLCYCLNRSWSASVASLSVSRVSHTWFVFRAALLVQNTTTYLLLTVEFGSPQRMIPAGMFWLFVSNCGCSCVEMILDVNELQSCVLSLTRGASDTRGGVAWGVGPGVLLVGG